MIINNNPDNGNDTNNVDLPVGLGMRLISDSSALRNYNRMTGIQKKMMIDYIQRPKNEDDAGRRISEAVSKLRDGDTDF